MELNELVGYEEKFGVSASAVAVCQLWRDTDRQRKSRVHLP